ncbi:MAG: hypothetical protein Q7S10_01535 [bacterium]|nr:hypothetical protein [bacterium]
MTKSLLLHSLIAGVVISVLLGLLAPRFAKAETNEVNIAWNSESLTKIDRLTKCGIDKASYGVSWTKKISLTAYSSRVEETDDTPFIAASGKHVFDGMIAINGLKFGTKVKIPQLYGDKIFVVEDRMNTKYGNLNRGDIWMAKTQDAIQFGLKRNVTLEILEG